MKNENMNDKKQRGRFGLDILLWLVGIPLPLIIIFSLLRGCR
jgi:hypothetical protein